MRRIVTAEDLLAQARDGRFVLQPGDLLSPLVHEVADRRGIVLVPASHAGRDRVFLCVGHVDSRPVGHHERHRGHREGEGADPKSVSVSSVPLVVPPAPLQALLDRFPGASSGATWTAAVAFPSLSALRSRGAAPGLAYAVFSVAAWDVGAYTGEVSARMAVDAGASAVVLGLPGTEKLPEKQRELLPLRVARALEHGMTAFVGLSLAEEEFAAGPTFGAIRNRIAWVREGAGPAADKIRWFWCHPAGRPPRLAPPLSYVGEMEGFLGAAGVGLFDPSGSGAQAAFSVEVAG